VAFSGVGKEQREGTWGEEKSNRGGGTWPVKGREQKAGKKEKKNCSPEKSVRIEKKKIQRQKKSAFQITQKCKEEPVTDKRIGRENNDRRFSRKTRETVHMDPGSPAKNQK